jgi:hypothetical protein
LSAAAASAFFLDLFASYLFGAEKVHGPLSLRTQIADSLQSRPCQNYEANSCSQLKGVTYLVCYFKPQTNRDGAKTTQEGVGAIEPGSQGNDSTPAQFLTHCQGRTARQTMKSLCAASPRWRVFLKVEGGQFDLTNISRNKPVEAATERAI